MEFATEPEHVERPKRRSHLAPLLAVVILAAGLFGYLLFVDGGAGINDLAVKQQLERLGALVVLDANGVHVASVNLSTVTDPAKLQEALSLLPALTSITALDVSRRPFKDDDLAIIGRLRTLVSLAASSTEVTDAGLAQLAALTKLESLHLSKLPITSAGLPRFAPLKRLKVLNLSSTQVTSGLEPLAALPQLQWLLLGQLSLEDSALTALGDAPQLKHLTLLGSDFSQDSLSELRRRRPGLKIDL